MTLTNFCRKMRSITKAIKRDIHLFKCITKSK